MKTYDDQKEQHQGIAMHVTVPTPSETMRPAEHLEEVAYKWNNALLIAMQNMWSVPKARR